MLFRYKLHGRQTTACVQTPQKETVSGLRRSLPEENQEVDCVTSDMVTGAVKEVTRT